MEKITKNAVWQLIGKFLLQGFSLFITPIITRLLSPVDYGYVAVYLSWNSILSLLIGLQTFGSIANARLKYDSCEINKYLASIYSVSLISFFVFLFAAVIFNKSISQFIGLRGDIVILLVIFSFSCYTVSFVVSKFDQFKEAKKSTILSSVSSITGLLLSLILVLISDNKACAKIYGESIPNVLITFVLIIYIYIRGKTFIKKEYITYCFSLTLPLLFHGLGGVVFSQFDRIMLQKMIGVEELGVYTVTYLLCNILNVIYGALNITWVPFYYDYKKQNNNEIILRRSFNYLNLFTIITLGFLCLSPEVFKFLAPKAYWSGIKTIPLLTLSFFFNFLYLFPVNFEFYNEKVKLIPIATIIAAAVNIMINFILIPIYGIIGAALGTLISNIFNFIFHYFIAKKVMIGFEYPNIFFIRNTLIIIISCIVFYLLLELYIVRWLIAVILGIYQLLCFKKNKTIF